MPKIKKKSPHGLRKTVYPDNTLKTLVDLQNKLSNQIEFVAYTSDQILSYDEVLYGKKIITNESATSVVTYTLPPVQYGAIFRFLRFADFNMIISADGSDVIDNVTDDYILYGGNSTVTLIGTIEGWKIDGKGADPIPIGAILAIHPSVDFTKALNGNYWKLCDGTPGQTITYPDGSTYLDSTDNFDIPELTDNRFLQGISGTSASSDGTNVMIDHRHSTNSSDLVLSSGAFSGASGSISGTAAGQGGGGHIITDGIKVGPTILDYKTFNATTGSTSGGLTDTGASLTVNVPNHTHSASSVSGSATGISGSLTSNTVSGTIGTTGMTNVSAGTIDNRPKYFTVRYYMKIR